MPAGAARAVCPHFLSRAQASHGVGAGFFPAVPGHPLICTSARPHLHVRRTCCVPAPLLSCPSPLGRMQGRRGALPVRRGGFAGPQPLGCKSASARLHSRIRAAASLYPRRYKFVSARLQKTTRAGTGFHPGRYVPASVRVRLCIRADTTKYPCGCDFSSGQMRLCIRAGATFHPGRYDPASVRVRFYSPSDTRKHPQGCLGASLRV